MLPQKKRVERTIFPETLQRGKSGYSPFLNLKCIKRDDAEESKFSFVVSKAVAKKAVQRNLLRRRGYSIIKDNQAKIRDSFTCIFFFKKESNALSFKELEKDILFLLKKADVLK